MKTLLFGLMMLSLSLSPATIAWEADTHYGLIKWLAYQAGFSLDHAELVAASSQSADETHVLAATYLVAEVCLRRDAPKIETVSRVVQQHHFPAPESVPNQPLSRDVVPGMYGTDNAANRWVRQEIADQTHPVQPIVRLERFGSALHPLGDSWSHQGNPDVPEKWFFDCRNPELAWSHPETRGGWRSHNADQTWRHPLDTAQTAETAYRFMLDFLQAHQSFVDHAAKDWTDLEARVIDFASRRTRDAKYDWFMSEDSRYSAEKGADGLPYNHFSTYRCFLKETSLKWGAQGDPYPRTKCAALGVPVDKYQLPPPPAPQLALAPDSPWNFTNNLLDNWLVSRNTTRVVEEFSDVPAITRAYISGPTVLTDEQFLDILLKAFLIEDHGWVSDMDHGLEDPAELRQRLNDPDWAASTLTLVQYDALQEVADHPCSALPFELVRHDYESENSEGEPIMVESFIVIFRIRHAPRDLMLLRIEKQDGDWKMTSLGWVTQ